MPLALPPWLLALFVALFGLAMGSFATVLLSRLPRDESLGGRSRCPHCKHTLNAHELVPVLSYAVQLGRCRRCKARISWAYPAIELAIAATFLASFWAHFPSDVRSLVAALLLGAAFSSLFLIAVVDARSQQIPDVFNIAFGICALGYALAAWHIDLLAPLLGVVFFGLQWAFSRGQWVGSGDIFLSIGMGLLLGDWQLMALALFVAYIVGAVWVAGLLFLGKKTLNEYAAFAPFLALGTVVAFFWGDAILAAVLR